MPASIYLYRYMRTAWRDVAEPWLRGHGRGLERSYVVVPTRGQAHAFKQQCIAPRIPLLGVELLTPGLARRKWAERIGGERLAPPLGREFLLLGLRTIIQRKLAALAAQPLSGFDEHARTCGVLRSLRSDCERALEDFDSLLRSGFSAAHFPDPVLRDTFGELTRWVHELGYGFVAEQTMRFVREGNLRKIPGRLLIHGFSAEQRNEFYNLAAFACCFTDVTVTLPEAKTVEIENQAEAAWIELWEKLLGAPCATLDDADAPPSCENVAELWTPSNPKEPKAPPATQVPVEFVIGATRADEIELVARKIAGLIAAGAENIGVIFPAGDIAHARLVDALTQKGVGFTDQIGTSGAPPVEVAGQRALLSFYQNGCTLEGLLELWPLLKGAHKPRLPLSAARKVCEGVFDESQSNRLSFARKILSRSERDDWREVARVADLLLDADGVPDGETDQPLEKTIRLFFERCERFSLGEVPGRAALAEFSTREKNPLPREAVFAMLASFLPEKSRVKNAPGRGSFARVTLTTRHRAEGALWSHLIFCEANADVWPQRRESGCWLPDGDRKKLNETGASELALLTADDGARLEKASCAALARDTEKAILFSAALHDEQNAELKLSPNAWAERAAWHVFSQSGGEASQLDAAFRNHAQSAAQPRGAGGMDGAARERWLAAWENRRNPSYPFDEYFLCVKPGHPPIASLAAREIEGGVKDPASLWFKKVLRADRVNWSPFERNRNKNQGTLAHRVLAMALRGDQAKGNFGQMPAEADARLAMTRALAALRAQWPADSYWDSFHAELCHTCETLLGKIYHQLDDGAHAPGRFVATELRLPEGAKIPLDENGGQTLHVTGSIDLVRLDRPSIEGADVDIVDFKTGKAVTYSSEKMGRDGTLLQLGVYLAAAKSLGAADGRVWVAGPDTDKPECVYMADASVREGKALACLAQIARHINSGRFGALTKEPSEFSKAGLDWPVACVSIPEKILKRKFAATFGAETPGEESGAENE